MNTAQTFPAARFAAAIILLALAFGGCGGLPGRIPTGADGQSTPAYAANLRKTIGLAPFRVESSYGDRSVTALFQDELIRVLRAECPELRFIKPGDEDYPEALADPPRLENGRIDNFELALIAREQGLQAVIVTTLISISPDRKDVGFWWFKDAEYSVRMDIRFEIFDSESAAKLMDQTVERELEIDVFDYDQIRNQAQMDPYIIEDLMAKIAAAVKPTACESLDDEPWKNFITASRGNEVLIAAGRQSGLRPGHVLDVYESAGVIDGAEGQRYIKPGRKIGTVQVKIAFAETAQGIRLSGETLPAGSVVRAQR
jgi:hypothetical protein